MATSMYASSWSGASRLVAIEVEGRKVFHVELKKLEKYPQLYMQITCHAPPHIYGHVYNGMGYPYYQNLGPFYINLRTVSQGAGHVLWEYLTFGTFTPLLGNPSEKRQEEYFKSIIHVHNVADQFSVEDLKSGSATEIFRRAQDMGLMELFKLLEEANYRSDSFPELSVYLEKRLVGSALDYGVGDSQRAVTELRTQPSLSVAQMLLKAITEISHVGRSLDKQHSRLDEVYRREVVETMAASEVVGLEESKSPETRWIKPKIDIAGVSKSVGSRFFGPAAKQENRSGMKNHIGRPLQRAAVPEPTFYSPREPAFIPPSMFLPSLVPRPERNEHVLLPPFGDTSTTLRYGKPSSTSRRTKTLSEMERELQIDAMSQEQKLRHAQRRAKMSFEEFESQTEHNTLRKSRAPSPSTTSGEILSETATDTEENTADEATEACDRPVTLTGSQMNEPQYMASSFDAPLQSFNSSPDTLEGDPVEVEGSMDWDAGLSEYDYIP